MEGTKVYTFMVRFRDKPQVFRMIQIDGGKSLEDLHYAILEAFDFTPEHSYIFSRNQVFMIPKAVMHLITAAEKQRMRYVLRNWAGS